MKFVNIDTTDRLWLIFWQTLLLKCGRQNVFSWAC